MGVSLWLVPSAEHAELIESIMSIRQTKLEHPLSSYPKFYPHVTLASFPSSHPPISEIMLAVPKLPHGLPVQFKSIEIGTHFFRSVYIAITPTPALTTLHEEVHRNLNIDPQTPAFPHLSLCYIDDNDALVGERDKFVQDLKDFGRVKIKEDIEESRISLRGDNDSGGLVWLDEFQAMEVWVMNCNGPVESWEVIHKIPIA